MIHCSDCGREYVASLMYKISEKKEKRYYCSECYHRFIEGIRNGE